MFGFIFEIDDYMATTVANLNVADEVSLEIKYKKKLVAMGFRQEFSYMMD